MAVYPVTHKQRQDDYAVLTLQVPSEVVVGGSITVASVDVSFNGTHTVYEMPQYYFRGVNTYGELLFDYEQPISDQIMFYDPGDDVLRQAIQPLGTLSYTPVCTWITAANIEDWLGIGVASVADQAFLTQCASAANAFCFRRRQEAGYFDSLTTVPSGDVALGTIQYGGMLYRQRGSIDSFASFSDNGGTAITGLSGVIKQLLGIDRPQVA
jgi:hypothetical protein